MTRKGKRIKFLKGEKILIFLIILFGILSPIITVSSKSILSRSNIELEKVKKQVEKQENINESLEMQVDELASLSNIQDIAKEYGLSYNNDNIIVIK
ncbi:MAG: cell division protein FtsL [Bacilli bacterium]|nr:cell division protein FtsL [Bacilli bacterium]